MKTDLRHMLFFSSVVLLLVGYFLLVRVAVPTKLMRVSQTWSVSDAAGNRDGWSNGQRTVQVIDWAGKYTVVQKLADGQVVPIRAQAMVWPVYHAALPASLLLVWWFLRLSRRVNGGAA